MTALTLQPKCGACANFDDTAPGGQAVCRANPPTMTHIPFPTQDAAGRPVLQIKPVTGWPPVHPGSWCGQWKGRVSIGHKQEH